MEEIWKEVKAAMKKHIPGHCFRMWIEPVEFNKGKEGGIVLSCPNFFSRKRIQDHYGTLIESEIKRVTGKACKLSMEVSRDSGSSRVKTDSNHQMSLPNINRFHNGRLLRRDFTFDQFVVGSNNEFAYSAALSLASRKNDKQNSLFLSSKIGMGKSHLIQAIANYILSGHSSDQVYYITAEDFTNEMIHAFRHNSINKFKDKYRTGCDVLLLEDVHYLTGKERTQIELALTLDTLFEADKKIIFSSCYLPGDIPKLNDKLRSRISGALISNIDPPDFRTRVRILQKKSMVNGYNIPEEVTHYLAGELTEDVRQLESGLIGVTARASLLGATIDLGLAESVVKNMVRIRKAITIDVVKELVCKQYQISGNDIISSSRKQCFVRPRQIAIYLARRYTDLSLQALGKSFNRYHATALYAINVVESEIKANGPLKKQVEFLCQKLDAGKF